MFCNILLILTFIGASPSVVTSLILHVGRVCSRKLRYEVGSLQRDYVPSVLMNTAVNSKLSGDKYNPIRVTDLHFFNTGARKVSHKCPMN